MATVGGAATARKHKMATYNSLVVTFHARCLYIFAGIGASQTGARPSHCGMSSTRLCSDRVASGPLAGPSEQGHIVPTWSNAARVATALPNRGRRPWGPPRAVGAPVLGRYVTNLNLVTRFHTCIWISFS